MFDAAIKACMKAEIKNGGEIHPAAREQGQACKADDDRMPDCPCYIILILVLTRSVQSVRSLRLDCVFPVSAVYWIGRLHEEVQYLMI